MTAAVRTAKSDHVDVWPRAMLARASERAIVAAPTAPDPLPRVHLSRAHITDIERHYVLEALESGWVAPAGPSLDAFEVSIAERVGVQAAVGLSSGTAALHLGLLDAGAKPGRVVLVPSVTFAATANAVLYTGAVPIFVDSRRDDGNLDVALTLDAVDRLRAEGEDVAAVVTVDLFGRACDYTTLEPALAERGVALVEDSAEALGATHHGRAAGSFGKSAVLSFNGNKILTTSGGGMLLTNDLEVADRVRHLASQARQPTPWYEHEEMGFNYRLSNLLAALGLAQLTRLDEMMARRRAIREQYAAAVAELPGVSILGQDTDLGDREDNCWLTALVVDPDVVSTSPDDVIKQMDLAGIDARHLWKPMHLQPVFHDARMFGTGVAEKLFASCFLLPGGSELGDSEIDRVLSALRTALRPGQ